MRKTITSEWVVPRTTELSYLEIKPGARMSAPAGHTLTMTVNGIGTKIEEGVYQGDIVLAVAKGFRVKSVRFGEVTEPDFRMGVCIKDGEYLPECSVPSIVRGGTVSDKEARDIIIRSDEWDFNGIYVAGNSEYTVCNADIELNGDGTDDFVGLGAGIAASGNARVTVRDSSIRTNGITRGAVFVGGHSEVSLEHCDLRLTSYVPTPEQLAEGAKLERMMQPPWSMGIRGNGRTTNLAGWGVMRLDRCRVVSNSWGVLSVDGATVNRMYVRDSLIELQGDSGYGCFSICDDLDFDYRSFNGYGCIDRFEHSLIRVPTYGVIMSLGNASSEFAEKTTVESGRFGAFIFRNSGGYIRVDGGSRFLTAEACFLVKGANAYIYADDAELKPKNGIILQLMDNDDTGMEGYPFFVPIGETDAREPGRDLTCARAGEDVFARFSHMEITGDIYNSTTNLKACCRLPTGVERKAAPPMQGSPNVRGLGEDLQGAKNLEVRLKEARYTGVISCASARYRDGVTVITQDNCEELGEITCTPAAAVNNGVIVMLEDGAQWTVTGEAWLTSLSIEAGCKILGADGKTVALEVDGKAVPIVPGAYTGNIHFILAEQ